MFDPENIHLSLDDARSELKKRWNNVELRQAIEKDLGKNFMPSFLAKPRGVSFRQVCPPDNGFVLFYQGAKYVNAEPLVLEYHDDMFVHFNVDKKGLGRKRVFFEDGTIAMIDIMSFFENEKNKLGECLLKGGERLVDFHRNLFDVAGYQVELLDNSEWFGRYGRAEKYYHDLLLHFVAHGVLFENIEPYNEDGSEAEFIINIVNPAIKKIEEKYGIMPLYVRMYPLSQDEKEDFYWWCNPRNVNDYLVKYARENNLPLKYIDKAWNKSK